MTHRQEGRTGLAMMLALGSALILPFVDAMVKILVVDYSVAMIAWVRMGFSALVLGSIAYRGMGTKAFQPAAPKLQVLRGLSAVVGTTMAFLGFRYMPLAECLAIILIAPILSNLLSLWWLKESGNLWTWLAAVLSFIGVLVIARPGSSIFSIGAVYALIAACGLASYITLTRAVSGRDDARVTAFLGPLVAFLMFSLAMPTGGAWPKSWGHLLMFIGIGLLGTLANFFQTHAYRYGTTHQIAPISYTSVVVAIGVGWLVFGSVPDSWSLIGMAIISLTGILIVLKK